MKASDVLVSCLETEGVEHVFGIPGEELTDVLLSLRESSIQFVPVRHEQGAAFMVDVHGRLTDEASVCLSTLGPSATNLLTGVADAHLDKSPLVAITGQGSLERLHKESHQTLDIVDLFEPITKWNTEVDDPDIIAESVRKAFKLAESKRPGATHIEFPEDVAATDTDTQPLEPQPDIPRTAPDSALLTQAITILRNADRPMIIAGNGAVRPECAKQLRSFVEQTHIPVVATYMGKGAVSDETDYSLYTLDSGSDGQASRAIEQADVILTIGYDVAEQDPEGWNPDRDKRIIHLDYEPAEVYTHYQPEVELVCDIPAGLQELRDQGIDPLTQTNWYTTLREDIVAETTQEPNSDESFTVRRMLPILRDILADDDVLISDVGSHKMAIAQDYPTYEPNTCLISNGLASMGIAVPGAVAADLTVEHNVVAATGDGGFLMNAAEIETATRLDLGLTILLFNDNEYRLISEEQHEQTGEVFGTELTNPDFVTFAESFGIDGYRPESWDELAEVLQTVVPADEMALVEMRIE